jgi:hypothetical protein
MRSLILSGLVSASLAFAGNGAAAATVHAKPSTARAPAAHARVAAQYPYPAARYGYGRPSGFDQPEVNQVNPAQIINSLLSSPLVAPYVAQYAPHGVRVTRGSGGGSYEPYDAAATDTSSLPDTSTQDMLNNQAADQAIQQMNDTNAMNASMAAAAEQNAADTAAMNQQIMNNGGL